METGRPPAEGLLEDPTLAVKDIASAKSYLVAKQYLPPAEDVTVSQLIGILSLIAADKATSKPVANVVKAISLLLKSKDVTAQSVLIANAVSDRLEGLLDTNRDAPLPTPNALEGIEQRITESVIGLLRTGHTGFGAPLLGAIELIPYKKICQKYQKYTTSLEHVILPFSTC